MKTQGASEIQQQFTLRSTTQMLSKLRPLFLCIRNKLINSAATS